MADVVVVGAGVIGSACAWRLAQAGLKVTLLERSAPAAGASQAALGVLQFHAKVDMPPAYQQLTLRSRDLFPSLLAELAECTGERVPYRAGGQISLALDEGDWRELDEVCGVNAALGLPAERLTVDECRLLEPGVTPRQLGGLFFTEDAWVDNTALNLAMARAAEMAGARLERGSVEAILLDSGRAAGVRANGQAYPADWVVLAAGCWSPEIAGVPPLPIRPVRGQALAVQGQPVRRVVSSPRGYLVPKGTAGQTLVGATVEYVGYDGDNTLGGLAHISQAGLEIAPGLRSCTFVGAWAGLRPGTPDALPCIGPFEAVPNLIVAAGHFRNGILQAPSTAEAVCALIAGAPPPIDLTAFRPDRLIPPGTIPPAY